MKKTQIYYVIEGKGWVQHKRLDYLRRYLPEYEFKDLTLRKFQWLWRLGLLKRKYIFFSNWRIAHSLLKEKPGLFSEADFHYMLAAVTSHSNIGGGLDPKDATPGREPKEAYALAVPLLKKFRVVTANSKLLFDLLERDLPSLLYCPTAVDTDFFVPRHHEFRATPLRVGTVGRARSAKNFKEVHRAIDLLGDSPVTIEMIEVAKSQSKYKSAEEMRNFYQSVDFYLCASTNEGTPNPALEAAACGVPIVSTRVGNMCELIEDGRNGFWIEPTAESIRDRLNTLIEISDEQYQNLCRNVRMDIEKEWTWTVRAQGFRAALRELTRGESHATLQL